MQTSTKTPFYQKTWFILLMLLIFPPVGIFLLWKFGSFGKPARIALTVISVLIFFVNFVGGSNDVAEESTSPAPTETVAEETTEPEEPAEPELTPEEQAELEAEQAAAAEAKAKEEADAKAKAEEEKKKKEANKPENIIVTSSDADALSKAIPSVFSNISSSRVEGDVLVLSFKQETFWSENSLAESFARDSVKILETISENENFSTFAFERDAELVDGYGNERDETVLEISYNRSTIDKINFDNFKDIVLLDPYKAYALSDGYFIHVAIYKNLKEDFRNNIGAYQNNPSYQ